MFFLFSGNVFVFLFCVVTTGDVISFAPIFRPKYMINKQEQHEPRRKKKKTKQMNQFFSSIKHAHIQDACNLFWHLSSLHLYIFQSIRKVYTLTYNHIERMNFYRISEAIGNYISKHCSKQKMCRSKAI